MYRTLRLGALSILLLPATTLASSLQDGANSAQATDAAGHGTGPTGLLGANGAFNTIANLLVYLVGALAVVILIFGGFRYVASTGDAGRVKQAKDTILYGIVGVVVAVLAYAIINFVLSNIK
jgi:hypothetical protein